MILHVGPQPGLRFEGEGDRAVGIVPGNGGGRAHNEGGVLDPTVNGGNAFRLNLPHLRNGGSGIPGDGHGGVSGPQDVQKLRSVVVLGLHPSGNRQRVSGGSQLRDRGKGCEVLRLGGHGVKDLGPGLSVSPGGNHGPGIAEAQGLSHGATSHFQVDAIRGGARGDGEGSGHAGVGHGGTCHGAPGAPGPESGLQGRGGGGIRRRAGQIHAGQGHGLCSDARLKSARGDCCDNAQRRSLAAPVEGCHGLSVRPVVENGLRLGQRVIVPAEIHRRGGGLVRSLPEVVRHALRAVKGQQTMHGRQLAPGQEKAVKDQILSSTRQHAGHDLDQIRSRYCHFYLPCYL